MASRPHTTYKKRQKELARMEKQREKAARRQQRKLDKTPGESFVIEGIEGMDAPLPGPGGETEDVPVSTPALDRNEPPREI
jgi:hypothetical protein